MGDMIVYLCLFFVLAARHAVALDPLEVKGQYFQNPKTNKAFRIFGFDYSISNDTSSEVDVLSDPETCLRDAALMQVLNVNSIQVTHINPDLNHDLCVSIFNAAGIYIAVGLEDHTPAWETAAPAGYNDDFLSRSLAIVDAFKDYENTLSFYVVDSSVFKNGTFSELQPYIRATVREVKSYVSNHASRKIPVGMRILFNEPPYTGALETPTINSILHYASCVNSIDDESNVDFLGFWIQSQIIIEQGQTTPPMVTLLPLMTINANSENSSVPILMEGFRDTKLNSVASSFDALTPKPDWSVLPMTYDHMINTRGIFMLQWANTKKFTDEADWGHVDIVTNAQGNTTTYLKPVYDSLKKALQDIDLEFARSGQVVEDGLPLMACNSSAITQYNSTWDLPKVSDKVQALIDNGVNGRKGSTVPIPVNVTLPVYNSAGKAMNGLAITPPSGTDIVASNTPSESIDSTTASQGLSTGAKAGIGVAVPLAVIILTAALVFLFKQRRKRAEAAQHEKPHELFSNDKVELGSPYNAHEVGYHHPPRELDAHGSLAVSELPTGDHRYSAYPTEKDKLDHALVEMDSNQSPRETGRGSHFENLASPVHRSEKRYE